MARPGNLRRRRRGNGGNGGIDPDRTRKAFARRQRARQWLTWRKILAVVAVILAISLVLYAVYFSPWLRAERAQVVGLDQLTRAQVLERAAVRTGGPLATVDLDAIRLRLESMAPVKSVEVSRRWPHEVLIRVVERTPVAVLDSGATVRYIDAEGISFGAAPRGQTELPRIKVGGGADGNALKEGAAVVTVLDPQVTAIVDYVEVRTVDEILLHLRDGRLVRWGSSAQAEEKAQVLLRLLEREAGTYDVSVPGAPTTR